MSPTISPDAQWSTLTMYVQSPTTGLSEDQRGAGDRCAVKITHRVPGSDPDHAHDFQTAGSVTQAEIDNRDVRTKPRNGPNRGSDITMKSYLVPRSVNSSARRPPPKTSSSRITIFNPAATQLA